MVEGGERENNGQGESESFNTREREIWQRGEKKHTPRMHCNKNERERAMAKEKEGDSIEGRERDGPLGCVAIER